MAVTLYWVAYASAGSAPTGAQIVAGQDATGSAALASGSEAYTSAGTYDEATAITSLSAGTSYRVAWVAYDGSTYSSVVVSDPITTAVAIGIASESDSALPVTAAQSRAIGIATESNAALPVTAAQARAIGIASEADSALPISVNGATTIALGVATESDAALPITARVNILLAVGTATESDTALPVSAGHARVLGQATETDIALSITSAQSRVLGIASEADSALPLTFAGAIAVPIGTAYETDEALPFGGWSAVVSAGPTGGGPRARRKRLRDFLSPPSAELLDELTRKEREALGILPRTAREQIRKAAASVAKTPGQDVSELASLVADVALETGTPAMAVADATQASVRLAQLRAEAQMLADLRAGMQAAADAEDQARESAAREAAQRAADEEARRVQDQIIARRRAAADALSGLKAALSALLLTFSRQPGPRTSDMYRVRRGRRN